MLSFFLFGFAVLFLILFIDRFKKLDMERSNFKTFRTVVDNEIKKLPKSIATRLRSSIEEYVDFDLNSPIRTVPIKKSIRNRSLKDVLADPPKFPVLTDPKQKKEGPKVNGPDLVSWIYDFFKDSALVEINLEKSAACEIGRDPDPCHDRVGCMRYDQFVICDLGGRGNYFALGLGRADDYYVCSEFSNDIMCLRVPKDLETSNKEAVIRWLRQTVFESPYFRTSLFVGRSDGSFRINSENLQKPSFLS